MSFKYRVIDKFLLLTLLAVSISFFGSGCMNEDWDKAGNFQSFNSEVSNGEEPPTSDSNGDHKYMVKRFAGEESDYDMITQANLFAPERIFIPVDSNASATPTPGSKQTSKEITNLRLLGTIVIDKEKSFALIVDKKDKNSKGKPVQYKMGDTIGDYTLAQVLSDRVMLLKDEELAVLKLKAQEGKRRGRRGSSRNRYGKAGDSRNKSSSRRKKEYKKPERRKPEREKRGAAFRAKNTSKFRSGVKGSVSRRSRAEGSSRSNRRNRYSCGG